MSEESGRTGGRRKVAVVTGGAAGIGRAVAERFAAGGYALALLDLDPAAVSAAAEDFGAQGVPALGIAASVTDEGAVEAAMARVVGTLGGIDVLINNAGVSCNRPTLELSLAEWQRAVDVNLTGVFLCARAAGRHMVEQRRGTILNIGSMYGTVAAPDRAAYCATKSAVDMLTDSETPPVPDTRSENMSEVSVRLSPLASVRIERRAKICVAALTSSA